MGGAEVGGPKLGRESFPLAENFHDARLQRHPTSTSLAAPPLSKLMKQCMRIRTQYLGSTLFSQRFQRFASNDASKSAVLLEKIEKGLGDDGHGNSLRIDPASKTIPTPDGSIPISPLMDPAWIEARGRFRTGKPRAKKPVGRFRELLSRNPYGTLRSWSSQNFLLIQSSTCSCDTVPTLHGYECWAPAILPGRLHPRRAPADGEALVGP